MDYLEVTGKNKLIGTVDITGAKNSILPLLGASLLCSGETVFTNCPKLSDVGLADQILKTLGCRVTMQADAIAIETPQTLNKSIPKELMEGMRSSFMFLGSMLARNGEAHVFSPGGCKLGDRPVDIHLSALEHLGARFEIHNGEIHGWTPNGFHGADFALRYPSVGATENAIMAAALAEGQTVLRNAAEEPEIFDLVDYLNHCGADITMAGNRVIVVRGVSHLTGCTHRIIPDRILTATLISCCAITSGDVVLRNVNLNHMGNIICEYEKMGVSFSGDGENLRVTASAKLAPLAKLFCDPYPGFPTDAGPILAAALSFANGESEIYDNVFDSRFKCASEMAKLGARMTADGRSLKILGSKRHHGAIVKAEDLRGGAALVCMALACEGTTVITEIQHIDRGYAGIEEMLAGLGANIRRKSSGQNGERPGQQTTTGQTRRVAAQTA